MAEELDKIGVLFVCMGNICRSPTAEGVFRKHVAEAELLDRFLIDSAGTHAYHAGEPPDHRARAAAERRDIDLSGLKARRVAEDDFERFDLILAMDKLNLVTLQDRGGENTDHVKLMLEYSSQARGQDVPDPYYGGTAGFERVLDLIEEASSGLLESIRKTRLG